MNQQAESPFDRIVGVAEAANFIGTSASWVRKLVDGGWVARPERGTEIDAFADSLPVGRFDNPDAKAQGRPP